MKLNCFLIMLFVLLLSCDSKNKTNSQKVKEKEIETNDANEEILLEEVEVAKPIMPEIYFDTFIQELNNELSLKSIFKKHEFMNFEIHVKKDNQYVLADTFNNLILNTGGVYGEAELKDFNNDGINDLLVYCGTGARGANQYSHLFLRDENDNFLRIKGSDMIPNLNYNRKRAIIEGVYYYGKTAFVDFELDGDSLIEIKGVEVHSDDEYTIRRHYISRDGNDQTIRIDSVKDGGQSAYSPE